MESDNVYKYSSIDYASIEVNLSVPLHGHETQGLPVIEGFCQALKIPNKLRDLGKLTSDNHLRCHQLFELKPSKIQKMMIEKFNAVKQPERFKQFLKACQCDAQGRGPTLIDKPYMQRELGEYLLAGLCQLDTKKIVQEALRQIDIICRIGGDEFLLILPRVQTKAEIKIVLKRVTDTWNDAIILHGKPISVTGNVGIAVYPDNGDTPEVLRQKADNAMYNAKKQNILINFHT